VTVVDAAAVDGRRARRERGRVAVVDAMVDLIQEGVVPPGADAVAERAGVSVASVFRYFDGLADLQEAAMVRYFERYRERFEVPGLGEGDLDDRIERLVRARLALYPATEPVARLIRARSIEHPTLARGLGDIRGRLAAQVASHFAPELASRTPAAAAALAGTIATLTSFEAWDQLHHDLHRTRSQIQRAWITALVALLG
jgi:AcrR family transcriptional regulator